MDVVDLPAVLRYRAPMHIDAVPNRGARPTYLLRESYREGPAVRKRTLANLSSLSDDQIGLVRAVLRGESLVPAGDLFEVSRSRMHGHVEAVVVAMRRLGLAGLLSSRPCRERALVLAMVAARVLAPGTKLATTRWWHTTTLAQHFGVEEATEDELYGAMDWLLGRQGACEEKLAARHLREGALALYDLSSSYFEGQHCPLAKRGYSRDGKPGKAQVNYGLLAARGGCPVAVSVYEGNTADAATLIEQVQRLRGQFGLSQVVVVGDRGMVGQVAIGKLAASPGVSWITALKSVQIRALAEQGAIQLGLFDEANLAEIAHPDYPGERLVVCRNAALGQLRARKREALIEATGQALERVAAMARRGRLEGAGKIGLRAGKELGRYNVGKHFDIEATDTTLSYAVNPQRVAEEAALDGIYVIRSPLPEAKMEAAELVRSYKALSDVERAFRSLKTASLHIRPIHHRTENRVRAHIFLCMLAYYVEWHMREAWRSLLFAEEDTAAKATRDAVAPAQRSAGAEAKARSKALEDGTPVHSFRTLLAELSAIVRNTCVARSSPGGIPGFELTTTPNAKQARALELLQAIAV